MFAPADKCLLTLFADSFFNCFFFFLGESLQWLWADHSSAMWLSGIEAQQRDSVVPLVPGEVDALLIHGLS